MAGTSGAIRAGAAFVEMSLRDGMLRKGLDKVAGKLKDFGSSISAKGLGLFGLGAAIMTPLVGAAKVAADLGSQFKDISDRTGVSIEALSTLGYAAEQSSLSMGSLESAFRKLNMFMGQAAEGSGATKKALGDIGLSYAELAKLSPEDQFRQLIKQLSSMENRTQRSAAAMRIFGKAGYALGPLLEAGADGIAEMEERAKQLGFQLSSADADAAESFGDQLDDVTRQLKYLTAQIGNAAIPIMAEWVEYWVQNVGLAIAWVRENRGLIQSVLKLGAGLMAAGAAVFVLGKAVSLLGVGFGLAGSAVSLLLSPVGLITAAVVGAVAAYVHFTGQTAEALDFAKSKFAEFKTFALSVWGGIVDALSANDLGLAAEIVWLTIKLVWKQGIAYLHDKWISFAGFFQDTWDSAVYALAASMFEAWADIQSAWVTAVAGMKTAWEFFRASVKNGWGNTLSLFEAGKIRLAFELGEIDQTEYERRLGVVAKDMGGRGEEFEQERRRIQDELGQQKRAIEGERQTAREQLEAERKRGQDARNQARQQARDEDQGEVDKARQALQESLDLAASKRRSVEEAGKTAGVGMKTGIGAAESRGSFYFSNFRGIGLGSSVQEQTLAATKDVAKNTKKLIDIVEDSDGLVFD